MFKAKTLKKYIPINKRMSITQEGEAQTLNFMLDLEFTPTYIESIVVIKTKKFNWFIDCEKLDIFKYIPAKADVYFYVIEKTTEEQKNYGFLSHKLMMNCVTFKPNRQIRTCTYITIDTQTIRKNDHVEAV